MKAVVYAPVALARLADILEYTIEKFGEAQADAYTAQLAARIEALATGTGPRARRCELLMQGVRDASGLTWYREGSHFLILREKRDTLEVVEILHGRMNLDEHLERLVKKAITPVLVLDRDCRPPVAGPKAPVTIRLSHEAIDRHTELEVGSGVEPSPSACLGSTTRRRAT